MTKIWGIIVFCMMLLLSNIGQAQEYCTLPQLREQAKEGWHETYTDKFGREVVVGIDVQVFGGESAPVLKVGFPEYKELRIDNNNPYMTVSSNVTGKGGRRTHIYRTFGERIDLDEAYGVSYGNALTLREMYAFMAELMEQNGIEVSDFVCDQPGLFDVLCNVNRTTGEAITPAFYQVDLWQKMNELPILAHVNDSFFTQGWPHYTPRASFMMSNRSSFDLFVGSMLLQEEMAVDIPLCMLERVIANIEKKIEEGYIQKIFSLRFGYALFNDPNNPENRRSAYDADCFYAVPSWVLECVYMRNPKDTFKYDYDAWIEKDPDYNERSEIGFKTIVVNAQTGVMLEPTDTSKKGRGDGDYKGFISWENAK